VELMAGTVPRKTLRSVVALLLVALQAATHARDELERLRRHRLENTEAWTAARLRLLSMCERGASCAPRLMKVTNAPSIDDWAMMTLPPYQLQAKGAELTMVICPLWAFDRRARI